MTSTPPELSVADLLFELKKEIEIEAPAKIIFQTIIDQVGMEEGEGGVKMNLKLEPWPGGRWYRDLGNNAGHLWGHVQVIKPPTLLELTGPMMMSYAVSSHVQYRLKEEGRITKLTFHHRVLGPMLPEHRSGMTEGWGMFLKAIKEQSQIRLKNSPVG